MDEYINPEDKALIHTRFDKEENLGDGYWLYKEAYVNFPEPIWTVYNRRYPHGGLVTFAYTRAGALFSVWRLKRKGRIARERIRRRGM